MDMRVGWVLLAVGLVLPSGARAAGLLEKEHPLIQQGRQAYNDGRYEDALSAFEQAKKERPNDPAVEFNRGDALMKLGRYDEAKQAFQGVADSNQQELRQKATYNLGNVYAATGNTREALKAYRRALTMNPSDAQARHNYEVLLKNLPPPQKGGPDGGTDGGQDGGQDAGQDGGSPDAGPDAGQQDGGTSADSGTDGGSDGGMDAGMDGGVDGGSDGGQGDAGQQDGGQGDGGQGDGGSDAGQDGGQGDGGQADGGQADGGQGDGGQGDAGQGEDEQGQESDGGTEGEAGEVDGGVNPEDIDRQEAERLLDAMKQNEKNLQLWRFQQKKRPRNPNEKDW
ncbi:tetratricopeptide repeat protein [Archangium violaceum]|uniref:tetratricopeptide repeat protein n=1 Tax=Archangium violaceum TaxID=83451 RepID=UPI002B291A78|nr:tetratricopeptide repeat protein [Archangium violaceum]